MKRRLLLGTCFSVLLLALARPAAAQPAPDPAQPDPTPVEGDAPPEDGYDEEPRARRLDDWDILGPGGTARVTGSAQKIDEEELERFEDDDAHKTLSRVPGVYVRGEDGYGLRPNIGLRGASSDRSKKITLLEDGVLIGPAPYSAPAAYYFPLMTRMVGVEVFKGPAALLQGPNTIGGAINFVSRRIPEGHAAYADLAAGTELYGKAHAYYGYGSDHWGVLIEGARLRSSGFKDLDGGGPTGFGKTELMAKARINTDVEADVYHEGQLKLGFAEEISDETYLGLSDDDFRQASLRRYVASALDEMRWQRGLYELSYNLSVRDLLQLKATAYRHDFYRDWFRHTGFEGGPAIEDILADPTSGSRAVYYGVLTGQEDSTAATMLSNASNARTFVSQGVQVDASIDVPALGFVAQRVRAGVRYHFDSIARLHTASRLAVRGGRLELVERDARVTTDNYGEAHAISGYLVDEITLFDRLLLTPGLRFERIHTGFDDHLAGTDELGVQQVVLPGVGVLMPVVSGLSVLGGVHQGFSPVAPGQGEATPEVAVNYELGGRFSLDGLQAEAIGFVSDYANLTGSCSFSSGCAEQNLDQEFNGGDALIAGVELAAQSELTSSFGMTFPFRASYTFTHTELQSAFTSDNPQLGDVSPGDELPYVPRHQAAFVFGALMPRWGVNLAGTFVDRMREQAGQGAIAPGTATDAYAVFDVTGMFRILPQLQLYARVENLLDRRYIVARTPLGARPGRPRFLQVGIKVEL